ncbi:unnamed protein product [Eruca vesicaria subsp. sativa]|uniref:cytidine deaminase n=1 Tax=Eruca vesicaria subsp. sativa TaxID=29727 RepID=A0ABC8JEJ6_ERUVS|nr:unnamed protein product [Eruca vesicaria subsp. sativa]
MAQPTRYVLSQDIDTNHVVSNPMNLVLLLKRELPRVRSRSFPGKTPTLAAGFGSSRKIYLGINIQLPGLPLHHSIHAEQFLLANLALNNERQLTHLAITSDGIYFDAPSGYCRQFLHETREASSIQILIKDATRGEAGRFETLQNLFPRTIRPTIFFQPLLLEPHDNKLTLSTYHDLVGNICEELERCNHLNCTALAAANRSYTPFTKSSSGVALLDNVGRVYRGWYMETVECGLSLGLVQAALVDFVARGGTEFNTIVQAVLVEKKDALVSQEKTTRMILKKITNGNCVINVFHCHLDVAEQFRRNIINIEATQGGFGKHIY